MRNKTLKYVYDMDTEMEINVDMLDDEATLTTAYFSAYPENNCKETTAKKYADLKSYRATIEITKDKRYEEKLLRLSGFNDQTISELVLEVDFEIIVKDVIELDDYLETVGEPISIDTNQRAALDMLFSDHLEYLQENKNNETN